LTNLSKKFSLVKIFIVLYKQTNMTVVAL